MAAVSHGLDTRRPRLAALCELSLRGCAAAVDDAGLAALATHAPALVVLRLRGCRVGDAGAKAIGRLPELQVLELADTGLSEAGLRAIGEGAPPLRELDLFQCGLGGAAGLAQALHPLHKFAPTLHRLNLDVDGLSDAALRALRPLRELRHLDLFGARVTDLGCMEVARAQLPHLESLELCGGLISDVGVAYLATMTSRLRRLNLGQNSQITDASVKRLAENYGLCLTSLLLSNTRITRAALPLLSAFIMLEELSLRGCQMPGAAREQLQRSLPNLWFVLL